MNVQIAVASWGASYAFTSLFLCDVFFLSHCREDIQTRLLKVGTTLYRCIAELALTLRASKITLMTAPVSTQLRILEGASILFRLALFGVVHVECFPPHPYLIPVSSLDCSSSYCNPTFVPRAGSGSEQATAPYSVRTFTDFDQCYEFLYGYWFKGLIHARLFPTQEYRRSASATSSATVASSVSTAPSLSSPALSISVHDPSVSAASSTLLPPAELVPPSFSGTASPRRPWYESRRIEVAATANRLRQEVESIVAQQGETALSTNDRIQVRRALKRSPFAVPASALLPTDVCATEKLDRIVRVLLRYALCSYALCVCLCMCVSLADEWGFGGLRRS